MKKLLLFCLSVLAVTVVKAQDEMKAAQEMWAKEKKKIMSEEIKLEGDASTAFWALYDEFQTKNQELGKKRFEVINDYINGYENIDDDLADELMSKSLDIKKERLALWKEYFKKMSKSNGAKVAARFIQIESYFENVVSTALSEGLPFVGDDE